MNIKNKLIMKNHKYLSEQSFSIANFMFHGFNYRTIAIIIFLFIPCFGFTQVQIGSDIDGEAANDYSGRSVSLSSDGRILAIGARYLTVISRIG
jgi:hypothetical protein